MQTSNALPLNVFEILNSDKTSFPAWKRRALISDDGQVFVPAAVIGVSEKVAALRAGYAAIRVVHHADHFYFPGEWVKREWPHSAEVVNRITSRLREAIANVQ